ncbi:DNA polymerase II subunit B3-1-like [Bidens hawaiensis]|uniref:DNA polymerase II subunit B3-1-like n=1 Tax=Bidens hawaiensis TaxID=980011 RepID=UPI00404A8114
MTTDPKPEKEKTPAPAKANGKRKTKNDVAPEEQVKLTVEVIATYDSVQIPPATNGVVSKKIKEDNNNNNNSNEKDENSLYQIPMSRVSRIIKSEDPNIRITQEAVYVINKASEKFLQVFTTEAYANAFLDHKKHIDYKHLSSVVSKRRRFDFLSDFVPEKLKAEEALAESQIEN